MADPGMTTGRVVRDRVDRDRVRLWATILIAVILVGWALQALAAIMIPIVFAFFLALVVAPADNWVAARVPRRLRWLGHVAAMTAILIALALFVGCLWLSAQQVVGRFSSGSAGIASLLPDVTGGSATGGSGAGGEAAQTAASGGETGQAGTSGSQGSDGAGAGASGEDGLPRLLDALRQAGGSFAGRLSDWASSAAGTVVSTAGSLVSAAVMVFFLTLLMLVEAPRWRDKLVTLIGASAREDTFDAIGVIAKRLRRYLLVRLVLGVLTAALYVGWLWFHGLDLLLVWGLLTVALNFVPTIGSLISGILPVIYAVVTRDPWTAAVIGAGILVIEQVMGNYIDPMIQGRQISLSPLVVLIVLLFWGWIWGVAGAVLAVPITITLLVFAAHVEGLRGIALLISDETDMKGVDRITWH